MGPAPRHALTLRAVALLCLAAVLAACTVGPSQRPPVAVRGENMPVAPAPALSEPPSLDTLPEPPAQNSSIQFVDCTEDILSTLLTPPPTDRTLRIDCGELAVPVDPDQQGFGATSLSVLRVGLAGAPVDRPPLLVFGDTAGQASARSAAIMAGRVAPALLERFTLVGMDRRGAGTDRLDCAPTETRAALVDSVDTDEASLISLLEQARLVVQECGRALDGGLGAYRSAAGAADVEMLRAGLGVSQLSALGVGDGAAALATWARNAPQAVGRVVLDSPPQATTDEPERTEAQAKSAEAAFAAFAVSCRTRPDCPLGADPAATVSALVASLDARPLAATDGRRLTAGGAATAVVTGLGEPGTWPALAAALAAAGTGSPEALLDVLDPSIGPRGSFDGMLATACNDTRTRLSPGEIAALGARWRTQYPLFGVTMAMHLLACAPWPTGGVVPASGSAAGAPPILVLGTAADPRGPIEGSRRTAESLVSARFLSWQGAGTGAYPRTPCVQGAVDAMLIDGVAPPPEMLCPP